MDSLEINERILEKLTEVERSEDVKILYCAESGSRSWGFASPDSDYDVRFIYVRRPEYYLKLERTRDVIEWQLDEVFDINGWDIQKVLRLLYGSNASLFEWRGSPIVYRSSPEWERAAVLADSYFNQRAALGHYLGLAKSNYLNYLCGETVRLKKYFYSLRPLLAARWIIDRGTPPPVEFSELSAAVLDRPLAGLVSQLVEKKVVTGEKDASEHIPQLDEYIKKDLEELTAISETIEPTGSKDWKPLDDLFISILGLILK